jgi:hypothetical protein
MSLDSTKYCKFPRDKKAARVAVAKDVIKWIRAGKMTARTGDYISLGSSKSKPSLSSIASNCTVCAMGAVLLSAFNKFDGDGFARIIEQWGAREDDIVFQLGGLFSESQLRLMEAAFEGYGDDESATWKFCQSLEGDDENDDNDRLMAIMQNVVDHGGVFRPEVQYEIVSS